MSVRRRATTIGMAERLFSKIDRQSSGCWVWTGTVNKPGYGVVRHDGRLRYVHREAYELLVEPIPAGLTIDHLCMNRRCLNPSHLEVVTRGENARRAKAHHTALRRSAA